MSTTTTWEQYEAANAAAGDDYDRRMASHERWSERQDMLDRPCPTCGVDVDKSCRSRNGRRLPWTGHWHVARQPLPVSAAA